MRIGPVDTESADRTHDEIGLDLAQSFPTQTEPLEGSGTKVLHHDIGSRDQRFEQILARFGLEIERYGALVAVL